MGIINFGDLAAALPRAAFKASGGSVEVAITPEPFVPPAFQLAEGPPIGSSEVIIIRASAAVGKSTLARALSASQNVPMVNLAVTPVATGSLVGLLSDLYGPEQAIEAFHAGRLPLIFDALDEGRLNSGDNSLLKFVETAAEFILRDRREPHRVKLVLLGRAEAVLFANLYLSTSGLKATIIDVGFFDEEGAERLVHAYASKSAEPNCAYLTHRKAAQQFVNAYFRRIADALGQDQTQLWSSESGQRFAGYAPVLAAIGTLLPKIDNFVDEANRLETAGADSPWGVIEAVLASILDREQGKLSDRLAKDGVSSVSGGLYSPIEQSALLLQYVQGSNLVGTGKLKLAPADAVKYDDLVDQWLPEHPFLRETHFNNDVIASYVFAIAIIQGWKIDDDSHLRRLARQPFLWRSLRASLSGSNILEGEYLGYILSSFWSDPLTLDERVEVRDLIDNNGSFVEITFKGEKITFAATTPLHFYGQLRNVDIKTAEPLSLIGFGDGAARVFSFAGDNVLSGSVVHIRATELRFRRGRTWLDVDILPAAGQFTLAFEDGAEYGWSQRVAGKFPFSKKPMTFDLAAPKINSEELVELLDDCARRVPAGTVMMMFSDYTVSENDFMASIFTKYRDKFSMLMHELVAAGFAMASTTHASGRSKIRVKLEVSFENLRDAALNGTPDQDLSALFKRIRAKLAKA